MRGALPGFRDLYPEDCALRNHIADTFRAVMDRFGFESYDGPLLEPLELFTDKSGPEIAEQLFCFEDRGGRQVALRPEMTPTLARMVGARAQALRRPIRWCTVGEHFRYERPQKGRLRSFCQLNGDILGEAGFLADGELIAAMLALFRALGLGPTDICLRLSDRQLWGLLLEHFPSCDGDTILRIVDRSAKTTAESTAGQLRAVLGDSSERFMEAWRALRSCDSPTALGEFFKQFPSKKLDERLNAWEGLLRFLGDMGLADFVAVDMAVVRGLSYYSGFVFEVFERSGESRAIAGGGRYDSLVEKLTSVPLPACGFAIGDVVLSNLLREKELFTSPSLRPDLWLLFDGKSQSAALALAAKLRAMGYRIAYDLRGGADFSRQLRQADRAGARFALIPESAAGQWQLKNFSSGETAYFSTEKFLVTWPSIGSNR
jgi:histidyl-tRNA synthetase